MADERAIIFSLSSDNTLHNNENGNRGATKGHRAGSTVNQSVKRVGQSLPVAQHSRRPLHADALAAQQTRLDEKLAAWKARRV